MSGLHSWRRPLVAGLIATIALGSVACGSGSGAASQPAPSGGAPAASGGAPGAPAAPAASGAAPTAAPQPLKARSAFTTISAAAAPWWVALDGGYFREQGLDVELVHI